MCILLCQIGLVLAETTVTGIINSDTVWTESGSPYILPGKVLVSNGATLTIEPNTQVQMTAYSDNDNLIVNGNVNAEGAYFIGSETAPNPKQIRINTNSSSRFSNCSFEHMFISFAGGTAIFEKNLVKRSGVSCQGCIEANFRENDFDDSGLGVSSSTDGGLYSQPANYELREVTIANNLFHNTHADLGIANTIQPIIMTKNTFFESSGIQVTLSKNTSITENTFVNNNGAHITLGKFYIAQDPYQFTVKIFFPQINYNNFLETRGFKLMIQEQVDDYIRSYISKNNISIEATNNYWGSDNVSTIKSFIRDYDLDYTTPHVNFIPYLTEEVSSAPHINTVPDDCKDTEYLSGYTCLELNCGEYELMEKHQCISCADDESVTGNKCVKITCGACEYASAHQCKKYECCTSESCQDSEVCKENECVPLNCNQYETINGHECISATNISVTENSSQILSNGKGLSDNSISQGIESGAESNNSDSNKLPISKNIQIPILIGGLIGAAVLAFIVVAISVAVIIYIRKKK